MPSNLREFASICGIKNRRGGFALVELLLAAVVLGLLLSGLVAATTVLRDGYKTGRAQRLLRALEAATETYARLHEAGGGQSFVPDRSSVWPPGSFDASPDAGLAALLAVPQTREVLRTAGWPWDRRPDDPAVWVDPWGRQLRYVTAAHDAEAVRLNGGRPFWVCAGPNGRFGDEDPAERADNISTDEPL